MFNFDEGEARKNLEKEPMIKKRCGELINEFINLYGCKKGFLCEYCKCSYPTLNKMLNGDVSVRIEKYISALWYIGKKYTDVLRSFNV